MGGSSFDTGYGVAVDGSGNVYTIGSFYGTADFDPGAGVFNLTSAGGRGDVFVSKLDSAGNLVWAHALGGTGADRGGAVAVDAAGNLYVTGDFHGTVDFDPGAGVSNLTSAGNIDVFVWKLDSAGNLVWAKAMGGTGGDAGRAIAVDSSGNVYTTGSFKKRTDFDPGPGVFHLPLSGRSDVFVSKLDSSGNFVWAAGMGGAEEESGLGVAVDGSGNVYTTGYFKGTADFDPGPGVSNLTWAGRSDVFVSKLDSSGNFVWAGAMGGTSWQLGSGVAVDGSGNVYIAGGFYGAVDFDPGPGVFNLTPAGENDVFVSKLDSAGSLVWAAAMGGTDHEGALGVAVDSSGDVYTTGGFAGTADFDPGASVFNLTSAGSSDVFVSKLDRTGSLVWATAMGGPGASAGRALAVDGSGNVYTTGRFEQTADFDPGPGVAHLTAAGKDDVFVSKLGPDEGAPVVTLTTPADGAVFDRDVVVLADYGCADEPGGTGLSACVGDVVDGAAIDTGTLGAHPFTVTGTDLAGNHTSVTHTYTVVPPPPTVLFTNCVCTSTATFKDSFGAAGDDVFVTDVDGDGVSEVLTRAPDSNVFTIFEPAGLGSGAVEVGEFSYGVAGDDVRFGDFDGNGTETPAVRRGKLILGRNAPGSGRAQFTISFGKATDSDWFVGDWDNDGTDTFAIRRGNVIMGRDSLTSGKAQFTIGYGRVGDEYHAGRWSPDASDTFTVRRGKTLLVRSTFTTGPADLTYSYGKPGDTYHRGDWNADGVDTFAVQR